MGNNAGISSESLTKEATTSTPSGYGKGSFAIPTSLPLPKHRWVLVQPVWGLCNRLRAVMAARMLAEDLGRELVLDWRAQPTCNCPWERLIDRLPGVQVLDEEFAM